MPTLQRRVRFTGREPIPKFARYATLCWGRPRNGSNQAPFPEAESIYNIACMCMYRHPGGSGESEPAFSESESVSYWSTTHLNGMLVYGRNRIVVPHHVEWFSVAWLRLPAADLASGGPYYEDYFRVSWELAL